MTTLATSPLHTPSQLSVHLKSLRKARGLTQAALGELVGVKQVRIADIEKEPGTVSLAQLMQVLHALDARLQLVDTKRYGNATTPAPASAQEPAADW